MNNGERSAWDEQELQLLKRGVNDGASASEISAWLDGRRSRCAVLGKINRLGLSGPSSRGGVGPAAKRMRHTPLAHRAPRPRKPAEFSSTFVKSADGSEHVVREAFVQPRHVSLIELEANECVWPYGDGPFTYCGLKKSHGPYCAAHAKLGLN